MNLDLIFVLAEVVGAAGVIVSLLFVAMQLRENTHALRAAESQSLHDSENAFYSDISLNPDLARIWEIAPKGSASIPEEDRPQWNILATRTILLFQMVHYQRCKRMVEDELWEAWDASWIEVMSTHIGIREAYEQNETICTAPFREYTDSCKRRYQEGSAAQFIAGRTVKTESSSDERKNT